MLLLFKIEIKKWCEIGNLPWYDGVVTMKALSARMKLNIRHPVLGLVLSFSSELRRAMQLHDGLKEPRIGHKHWATCSYVCTAHSLSTSWESVFFSMFQNWAVLNQSELVSVFPTSLGIITCFCWKTRRLERSSKWNCYSLAGIQQWSQSTAIFPVYISSGSTKQDSSAWCESFFNYFLIPEHNLSS